MHEASVAQSLLEQVKRLAPERAVVKAVRIEVGQLEHLDSECLEFVWDSMVGGPELSACRLEIQRVPVKVRCRACGGEYVPEDLSVLSCPVCHAARPEVIQGSGVLLRSIEIDENG